MADKTDMADVKSRSLGRKNKKGLALSAPPARSPAPSSQDAQIPGAIGNTVNDPGTLEIGVEFKLDLRNEDLIVVRELGAGNGGTVSKVMHAATKNVMARKVRHSESVHLTICLAPPRLYMWKLKRRYGNKSSESYTSCTIANPQILCTSTELSFTILGM